MVILRFKIRSKPDKRDDLMAALAEIITPARATEIDAVIDSGACGTVPTTVVDLTQGYPEVVRVGAGDPSPFV